MKMMPRKIFLKKMMTKKITEDVWFEYPKNKPSKGDEVTAIAQHWYTRGTRMVDLVYVDEDDVDFRFMDDRSEMSYDWSVISYKKI